MALLLHFQRSKYAGFRYEGVALKDFKWAKNAKGKWEPCGVLWAKEWLTSPRIGQ
jgi:hypothetical protein